MLTMINNSGNNQWKHKTYRQYGNYTHTAQKIKFSIKQFPADLVTFAEEIVNGKLHFLCSDSLIQGRRVTRNLRVLKTALGRTNDIRRVISIVAASISTCFCLCIILEWTMYVKQIIEEQE